MENTLEAVDPMVLVLKEYATDHVASEVLMRLDVCLSEALANLTLHAKSPQQDAQIDINLSFEDAALTADIYDPKGAAPFDLRDHARALDDVDAMAESGRGLGLILACADRVDYGPDEDRMRLSLTFWGRH